MFDIQHLTSLHLAIVSLSQIIWFDIPHCIWHLTFRILLTLEYFWLLNTSDFWPGGAREWEHFEATWITVLGGMARLMRDWCLLTDAEEKMGSDYSSQDAASIQSSDPSILKKAVHTHTSWIHYIQMPAKYKEYNWNCSGETQCRAQSLSTSWGGPRARIMALWWVNLHNILIIQNAHMQRMTVSHMWVWRPSECPDFVAHSKFQSQLLQPWQICQMQSPSWRSSNWWTMPDATVSGGLFMMTGLLCCLAGIVIVHIKSKVLRVII